jgi:2',3'-cyclic-nucleotide 2'-phosphodiesterase (5'-nucleotidase family)
MSQRAVRALFLAAFLAALASLNAQLETATPDVRVTVSMNADGTKTTYEFDAPNHRAIATTTGKDGKTVGRIRYTLDEANRFASGEVYGPEEKLRFKTLYKYDAGGKLTQEIQLGPDDSVRNKIVYAYDKVGKQIGYSVYDAAGKLIRQTPGVSTRATPTPRKK